MDRRAVVGRLLSLAAFIGLTSCAVSDTTQFYTLDQAGAGSAQAKASAGTPRTGVAGTANVGVGVGPVIMPSYLDRTQIVTRTASDQVDLSMFHRWAEPLDDGIARILMEQIGARVPTERIVMFPWRGVEAGAIQYQVVVGVLRFDGRPGGSITLDTRWRILGKNGEELALRRSTLIETAGGPGYEPMVAAMSRAVVILGQEIAAEIRALPR
ncbi:MAG TPA: PqiC family protein [Candidatus Methylomirabilis sp.]|nr:PqiC family protein [Candidatus Methylomirabilis sp.]